MELEKDTRTKIIEAAADIIGKEGKLNLTIRDIAGRAAVNVAAINYYFRSKDNLMDEVERLLMERIRSISINPAERPGKLREMLLSWADRVMQYLIDYPGILYMIGTRVLERKSTGLAEYLSLWEESLRPAVSKLAGTNDAETVRYKILQLTSGVIYPVLVYSGAGTADRFDINNRNTRRKYLASLVDSL